MKGAGWTFEFVSGPFDGHQVKPVPAEFCPPDEHPPPALVVWESKSRTHVERVGGGGVPDIGTEPYVLDDVDRGEVEAFYVWAKLEDDQRHRLREDLVAA